MTSAIFSMKEEEKVIYTFVYSFLA